MGEEHREGRSMVVGKRSTVELGELIRRLRKARGWTQEQLEEASGVPQPTISALERGRQEQTSFPSMKRLADALGVSVNMLLEAAGIRDARVDEDTEDELRAMMQLLRNDPEVMAQIRELGGYDEEVLRDVVVVMKTYLRGILRQRGLYGNR